MKIMIISVLLKRSLIFVIALILLCTFSGCITSKKIPPGEISKVPGWKNLYYFHSEDSTWIVKPITEAGNHFTGLIYSSEITKKSRQVHIYAEPLSSIKIENGKLTVPVENIVKVENYKISPATVIASVGVVAILFLLPVIF